MGWIVVVNEGGRGIFVKGAPDSPLDRAVKFRVHW
jgi:hypothetical protein